MGSVTWEIGQSTWSLPLAISLLLTVQNGPERVAFSYLALSTLYPSLFFHIANFIVFTADVCWDSCYFSHLTAEIWQRRTERAWGAESQPSSSAFWQKAASTHSEECSPHYQACDNGHASPVGQWHTCFLWPLLFGVLSAGWVVSITPVSELEV